MTTDADLAAHAQSDGDDLLFVDSTNTTQYNHEIEYYVDDGNYVNASIWVNITSLSSSVDTVIYMYYGNSICASQEHIEDTWDSNYLVVYHMDDFTSSSIKDSTGTQDGTKRASNGPQQVNGVIGYGQEFNNINHDRIYITGLTDTTRVYTFSVWAYINGIENTYLFDAQSGRLAVYARSNTQSGEKLGLYDGNTVGQDGFHYFDAVSSHSWHYITYTVTAGASNAYVNGTQ